MGFVVTIVILLLILFIFILIKDTSGSENDREKYTRYSKTGNWMDFDPGKDSKKVGDPKYPNPGADSVMKHEFMEELMDDKK